MRVQKVILVCKIAMLKNFGLCYFLITNQQRCIIKCRCLTNVRCHIFVMFVESPKFVESKNKKSKTKDTLAHKFARDFRFQGKDVIILEIF